MTSETKAVVEHHIDRVGSVTLHYVTVGSGTPLVLLHGWPQTWRAWEKVIPLLSGKFQLVIPDLRGLGESSIPEGGYDKRSVAHDIHELMIAKLGHAKFALAGHDWGGGVAFSLALHFPHSVNRLAILDVAIPGDGSTNISQGGKRWHHAFHQTAGLPEKLVTGREDIYLGWFFDNYGATADVIGEEERAHYIESYSRPGRLAAGFAYYRALSQDIAHNTELLAKGKLTMPVLALGGGSSWGRGSEVKESLQRVATNVEGHVIADCGHWMPEEKPTEVAAHLNRFFS